MGKERFSFGPNDEKDGRGHVNIRKAKSRTVISQRRNKNGREGTATRKRDSGNGTGGRNGRRP